MLTEEGLRALTTETRSPHPPAFAGTFSQWEKEGRVLYGTSYFLPPLLLFKQPLSFARRLSGSGRRLIVRSCRRVARPSHDLSASGMKCRSKASPLARSQSKKAAPRDGLCLTAACCRSEGDIVIRHVVA